MVKEGSGIVDMDPDSRSCFGDMTMYVEEEDHEKEEEDNPEEERDGEDMEGAYEEEHEKEEEEEDNLEEEEDGENMEGADEEEEMEYTFRCKNGTSLLNFLDNNDSGVQSYQQFECPEYEALANKKRKAVEDCHGGGTSFKKAREYDISGASMDEIMELMNFGVRRRSRKLKKRGRRKGSKNKLNPQLTRMLGDATIHYACRRYHQAIPVLHEVVRLAPNLPDSFHLLGLIYRELKDYKRAVLFYICFALTTRKDSTPWKLPYDWFIEQGCIDQACWCLEMARRADPEDVDAVKKLAELYQRNGQAKDAVRILEKYLKGQSDEVNASVVDLLALILMETKAHDRALQHIEHAQVVKSGKELPLNLKIKAGICHVHLGNTEMAQVLFSDLKPENASEHVDLVTEVANSLMGLEHYNSALNYYLMLDGNSGSENGLLYLKIARCYLSLKERLQAIFFFSKALETLQDDVDARLTLASLLLEEGKVDEAISWLSPPKDSESGEAQSDKSNRWWVNERVKLKLCNIYQDRGMLNDFVDAILPLIRESLNAATLRPEGKEKKRLSRRDLHERTKVLGDQGEDNILQGIRPIAHPSELSKAFRAKKLLQKKEIQKEKRKAEALATGIDWLSDDSDDEPRKVNKKPPLCNLLKDEEHHQLIIDLCKALASLRRYWEALEIINLTLRLAHSALSAAKKEELRSLGSQLACNTTDPKHGFDCVKYIVQEHPYSVASWNCYYKLISRLKNRDLRHNKFVRNMQGKFADCVPPNLISGHQFTMFSHHQDAARKYLEAYKLLPENPLVNLCVGTALINLALGFRLQNKHQCLIQGLAFLYNNLRICEKSQESLYNIARAYHHVGLVTLAALYYEKVLATRERDYPIPKLANEKPDIMENHKPGYCDLRREAAYNLHLIYKKSGALDLARQVLKDHCAL